MERKGRTGRELKGQTGKVKWKIKATVCMGKKKCKETHRKAGKKRREKKKTGGQRWKRKGNGRNRWRGREEGGRRKLQQRDNGSLVLYRKGREGTGTNVRMERRERNR